jgi:Uma2 family endonuclease
MATKTLLSLADYGALPEDGKRYELVEGELVELTFPNWKHSRIKSFLNVEFGVYLRSNPIGTSVTEAGFVLSRDPDTLRGPDVSFVSKERIAASGGARWLEGAPNLAVEILSPSNARTEIRAKVADYLRAGAEVVWVIDPERRAVEIFDSSGNQQTLTEDDQLTAPTLLPGFSVSVRALLDA